MDVGDMGRGKAKGGEVFVICGLELGRHCFKQIGDGGQIWDLSWVLDDEEQEPLLSASGCRG